MDSPYWLALLGWISNSVGGERDRDPSPHGRADKHRQRLRLARMALGLAMLMGVGGHALAARLEPSGGSRGAISLSGAWRFELDRHDAGVEQRWFTRVLPGKIRLPGSLPGQGIGDTVSVETKWIGGIVDKSWFTAPDYARYRQPGNVKVPFWLQPETYYAGVAWYQREFDLPPEWGNQRVVLVLERPHWETRVWLDDQWVGSNDSLSTPHRYQLGVDLAPGRHRLTIRVDNRMVIDIGENSHSISDHTQGNWNGIVGQIQLEATPKVWLQDARLFPRLSQRSVLVRGRLGNVTGQEAVVPLQLGMADRFDAGPRRMTVLTNVVCGPAGAPFEVEVSFAGEIIPWDEFSPRLYELSLGVGDTSWGQQHHVFTFGFRDFAAEGTRFTINGRPTFLRGTLECAIFPKTGHTPTEIEAWRKVIGAAKAHGLNNLRFHSHCPPEAAFRAADEMGMYLHVECGTWPNQSTTLGDGKPVDAWLYRETDRIIQAYGNHPSFVILLHGNEPGGPLHVAYLKKWVAHYRGLDGRRLYSSGAGWPQIPENQLQVTPDPRIQAWGGGLKSRINAQPPETMTDYRDYIAARSVPVISHEIGQWCVYPNFAEMKKYTGYLKPRNFEIFRETLKAKGLLHQARDFLLASGKLQVLCYKEEIESALRTPGMGGFQLLDLHDFPGQGTALVGVLDPFWEEKGYVTSAEFSRFCRSTVPLARLAKRVFASDEVLTAGLEVAHFGSEPLRQVSPTFKLVGDDGRVHCQGSLAPQDVPVGNGIALSALKLDLRGLPAPARYKLVVGLSGTRFENDWDLWIYPAQLDVRVPADLKVVSDLDREAEQFLTAGGKVLWLLPPDRVAPDPNLGKIELGFSSIFWNTAWTGRQAPHTLGILCDPKHPLFARFPTDFHSNWQWWHLIRRAGAMILDSQPAALSTPVQVVDDWFTGRKLGLVVEASVGRGRLLVCSVDLHQDDDLVVRQFKHSLFSYVASDRFQPKTRAGVDRLRGLMAPPVP
jgi:hypothetical protein